MKPCSCPDGAVIVHLCFQSDSCHSLAFAALSAAAVIKFFTLSQFIAVFVPFSGHLSSTVVMSTTSTYT